MLISNSSWITAASAFIFPAKSLQGILMTSRESLSLGHTVITHCQGGWKRTNRKFPGGKMCFISSPSSCQSSGRKTIETNYERRWKQPHRALPVPTLLPNSGPEIGMPSQAVIRGPRQRGTQHRNEMWPGRTPEPGRASQHRDCSSAPRLPQPYVCFASLLPPHEIRFSLFCP